MKVCAVSHLGIVPPKRMTATILFLGGFIKSLKLAKSRDGHPFDCYDIP